MSTYNGWTVVTMPSSPSAPASIEVTFNALTAVNTNPFTGQQQVQVWTNGTTPARFREISVSMPAMTAAQGEQWSAFIASCNGPACVFRFSGTVCALYPNELTNSGTAVYFRLKGNSTKFTIKEGSIYGLTFEAREAI